MSFYGKINKFNKDISRNMKVTKGFLMVFEPQGFMSALSVLQV